MKKMLMVVSMVLFAMAMGCTHTFIDLGGECESDADCGDGVPCTIDICGVDHLCIQIDNCDPECVPTDEVCDGRDDDCDGVTDEGLFVLYYVDRDGDGFGTTSFTTDYACPGATTPLRSSIGGDCDDGNPAIFPGVGCPACEEVGYYRDEDSDGYGEIATAASFCDGRPSAGYVLQVGDCDNADPSVHPGAVEICDGRDDNCDGVIDEDCP